MRVGFVKKQAEEHAVCASLSEAQPPIRKCCLEHEPIIRVHMCSTAARLNLYRSFDNPAQSCATV